MTPSIRRWQSPNSWVGRPYGPPIAFVLHTATGGDSGTVAEFATVVHRDFADKLKTARVWGTGVFDGQTVTRDHLLHDKDVVELHA